MKYIKNLLPCILLLTMNSIVDAQKQTFGVVSFTAPEGWQQQQNEGGVQLSVSDKRTGDYALAIITKATAAEAGANENFNTDWTRLVKATVQVDADPAMLSPVKTNGWEIISGNAHYTDGGKKGQATLLTATGGGQMVSVVLMTNTQRYQKELTEIINSLDLTKLSINETRPSASNAGMKNTQLAGLWTYYILETNGYINGMPQYTAGYSRSEYLFNEDGTYIYRTKNWMVYGAKDILFVYETGTYSANGSQITLTPNQVKAGWWAKRSSTKEWGPFVKEAADFKLEKKVFNYEIKYYSGSHDTALVFKTGQQAGVQEYSYSYRGNRGSLIDNPPGFKTGVENKSASVKGSQRTVTGNTVKDENNNSSGSNNSNSNQLPGTWGQYISESNTAGYDWREYYFNIDGSYQFLQKNISYLYQNEIVFAYERGTYKLNDNQLTISPQSGTVESWSKAGSDKAGKLLKTEKRTLETVTYTIDFHYFSGIQKTNLVLQYNKQTVRDGAFSSNGSFKNSWLYGRPFNPDKPQIELPAGTKIDLKYKPASEGTAAGTNKNAATVTAISPLTGKIWEGTTTEKFLNAGSTGYNTGGFTTHQYKFNADGTYRFTSIIASHYTDTKILNYETGTYAINGNQLTITPVKGYNEEWSKTGKTSNGNSDVSNRAVNETWDKKLKTTSRKSEQVTYTFSIGKNGEKTALILQYNNGYTEREGNGKQTWLDETAEERSARLPPALK